MVQILCSRTLWHTESLLRMTKVGKLCTHPSAVKEVEKLRIPSLCDLLCLRWMVQDFLHLLSLFSTLQSVLGSVLRGPQDTADRAVKTTETYFLPVLQVGSLRQGALTVRETSSDFSHTESCWGHNGQSLTRTLIPS